MLVVAAEGGATKLKAMIGNDNEPAHLLARIDKLERDAEILTGLVAGLTSAASMRARVAVRNFNAAETDSGPLVTAIALFEMGFQQAQLLNLQSQDRSDMSVAVLTGYDAITEQLAEALGQHAIPVVEDVAA